MSFTHLHVHSEYSLLDGLAKIDDLLDATRSMGMTSLALTDHGAMYGAFQFYLKALDRGIRPIIGVEAYQAARSRLDKQGGPGGDQYHLTLLAKNFAGYKNLMKLTTAAHLEGFYYKPRVDFEIMDKYRDGVIALSGCVSSLVSQMIKEEQLKAARDTIGKFQEIYGDNYYLELQRLPKTASSDTVGKQLIQFSREMGIPVVATNDVHYLSKDDAYAQEILLCIQTQHAIYEKDRPMSMVDTPEFYLKSPAEMKGLFLDIPEAIENTERIAAQCDLTIPFGQWVLPDVAVPAGETTASYLRKLVDNNLKGRFAKTTQEITQRIDRELDVIIKKGYATYFLIVSDIVNWAKAQGIAVGPGRGSVAGSLVAYILRITDIDPLIHNLPFERFLNPDRPTPPDIDIDFADTRRDEVLAYVAKKFGEKKVSQIITFGRMEARSAVRDVVRALGKSYATGDRIAKMIPVGKQGFPMTIDKAIGETPELTHAYQHEEETRQVLDIAQKIEGLARHSSTHAAGVVVSDKDLTEYVPLQREARGERIITQYDMYSLDLNAVSENRALGLLKIDFLGLRNLTILENAIKYVEQARGEKIDIETIPLDNKATFELISSGKTVGIFQLESHGMRRLAKDLKPSKLSDISAMVALYRPGPMDLIPLFLEGKRSGKKIKYLHPDLKPILEETYGILVYQEQVMQIAHDIAGYSMSSADTLRMAMGKKKKSLMKKEEKQFIERCIAKGYTQVLAQKIFGFIEKFAGYGFNKPHSASYGLIAYWTGYMKSNYPVEYMTALLSAELQGAAGAEREAKMLRAFEECKSLDIEVRPPDINKSDYDFKIEEGSIRFGLSAVKNVGSSAINSIVDARRDKPFIGLKDFLSRVDLRRVNKKTIESLIKAGAFDQFGARAHLMVYYPKALADIQSLKRQHEKGQYGLFSSPEQEGRIDYQDKLDESVDDFSNEEKLLMEREVFGFSVSSNPMSQYEGVITRKVTKKIGDISASDVDQTYVFAGTVSRLRQINTKKDNSEMAFLTVFDETGATEAVVFPRLYHHKRQIWNANTVILFKGRVNLRGEGLSVIIENAVDLATVAGQSKEK